MASLRIRELDDEIVEKLPLHAAQNSVSIEEEMRLGDMAVEYFGVKDGIDLELEKKPPHEPMGFFS